ncbi:tol-pal system YbgF family protein [Clostridium sp.]|uniref:tetratricopeptide repeat protein n=1 Tax=Clostridium sp. TaxID=1506 RepID=UPI0026DB40E6|nr:tetratricopeptide repeat protein [Clostridium sp.]MDO5039119.1 hypothetical protein [Clostridium sp.]
MGNFDKRLKKAKDLYDNKNYKEVLKICDKILEKEYNNEQALELEGEALLKLGRIEEAVLNWQINAEYNNNPTAKMRLQDVDDETKQRALNLTLNLSNLSKFINSEAKKIEKQKKEAKKIEHKKEEAKDNKNPKILEQKEPLAKNTIINNEPKEKDLENKNNKKQFETNIENKQVVNDKEDNKKDLRKDESNSKKIEKDSNRENSKTKDLNASTKEETADKNKTKNDKPSNKGKKSAIIAVCALIVVISSYVGIKHFKAPANNETKQEQTEEKAKMSAEELNSKLSDAISKNDYNEIYTLLEENPQNTITDATKENYDKALELMKTKGIEKFYNEGLEQYKFKTYDKALDSFTKAYKYCNGSYLEPHILYFLGSTYNSIDKKDDGAKYFQEYLDKYPHSDLYTAEILYNLSLYYHNKGDNKKAKEYAQHIENSYPSSPYYNDVTKDILYK